MKQDLEKYYPQSILHSNPYRLNFTIINLILSHLTEPAIPEQYTNYLASKPSEQYNSFNKVNVTVSSQITLFDCKNHRKA